MAVSAAALVAVAPAALDTPAFLAARGIHLTTGAAPGYVDDAQCASCHPDVAASFTSVGMSHALTRPARERTIERFGVPFEHAASHRTYQMEWRGEALVFRRWQLGLHGEPINELEQTVDWVLGSGNHARTYLFATPSGEIWQLPVAWYTQAGRWGMAPGYDRGDHDEVQRIVQRECLFCHAAYPELAAGADRYAMPHRFPAGLVAGIGCQRCHGPGGEHVRRARDPDVPLAAATAAIVNPVKLPPARRNDVCYQCHLQPAVALPAVRAFDRGDLAFRPGEVLAAHRVELDAITDGRPGSERFEINHHPYRLEQSRCFRESAGALSCLTCHDPHRKVSAGERAAHYRAACLTCHQPQQCPQEAHGGGGDCTGCHMPSRRTEDVVHVVMTDHRIQRPVGGVDLLAARVEHDPVLTDAVFLHPAEAPVGALGKVYGTVGVLRAGGRAASVPALEELLAAQPPAQPEPWLRLAMGELLSRRFAAAETSLRRALATAAEADTAQVRLWLALTLSGQGKPTEALAELGAAVARDPQLVEARFDRGLLLLTQGRAAEAVPDLEAAVALRPTLPAGWLRLGQAREALAGGDRAKREQAITAYRRALAVEPSTTDAWLALGLALRAQGDAAGAAEVFALGKRYARRPEALAAVGNSPPRR